MGDREHYLTQSAGRERTVRRGEAGTQTRPTIRGSTGSGNGAFIEAAATAVLGCWPWRRHAVVEAGIARPGQMDRFAATLQPDLVVVTGDLAEWGMPSEFAEVERFLEKTR